MINRKKRKGQGATEYVIILVLVAIGSIAVITIFGDNIRVLFGNSANRLQGDDTNLETEKSTSNDVGKGLDNY